MKAKITSIVALAAILITAQFALAQYTGGKSDGYTSSRSDDILYDGTAAVTTGAELPDIVHKLTIDNPGGVTLSKSVTVTSLVSLLNGDLNLNGNSLVFGNDASLLETPGNTIQGAVGGISATRTLNDLSAGVNVAGLGLTLQTEVSLGETVVARGHDQQELTPLKTGGSRFFDVSPTNNANLNATVDFRYDETELAGIPEADLALFISHDAVASAPSSNIKGGANTLAASPSWQFLGGTVDAQTNVISKGGVGDFSRLSIGRSFVFLAEKHVKIDGNEISEGDIHSNGKITFEKGEPGTHTGNLTAVDDIKIERNNTIEGDVLAGDDLYLRGNADVTGSAEEGEVPSLGLPTPQFTAKGPDVTVPKNGSLTLPPGSYDDVEVERRGTLFLSAGDYFMEELDLDDGAILSIDVTNGEVNLNVVEELEFDDHVEIVITPAGQSATNRVVFTTLQKNKVDIGEDCLILGSIIAPNAEVHFSDDCRFKGSVAAKVVTVEEEVTFLSHASELELGKPVQIADEAGNAQGDGQAQSYNLAQNYPNPFNPTTKIQFHLKEAGPVKLSIFNLRGQLVRTLIDGQLEAGMHLIAWDGKDESGNAAPSGVYFYKLRVIGFEQTKRMSLVK